MVICVVITIKELENLCVCSYPIYDSLIEDSWMIGEVATAELLEKEKEKVKEVIDTLLENYKHNVSFDLVSILIWLQLNGEEEGIDALVSCLYKVKQMRLKEIKRLQKDVDCCDVFIKNNPLNPINEDESNDN